MKRPLNILIIDDDEVDRMAVKRSLIKTGIELKITEESEAKIGINHLITEKKTAFDCVFLDYRLPDLDGLTLIKTLRQSNIMIPLVVLTGQGDEQIAVEMMKAGASDYLVKAKISPDNLAQILRNVIRVYHAEREAKQASEQLKITNKLLMQKNQELEQQRKQIEQQNLKLQETSRLKSQFLATMSHELRTPINAVMGFSQILLSQSSTNFNAQQEDMMQRIYNNSYNLLNLLNEVLDFSKIEAGQMTVNPNRFDVVKLATLTVAEIRSLAHKKQLTLSMQTHLNNPFIVSDQQCLRRILINLLSNGIKFTEQGEVLLNIIENSPDQITLLVKDT
jgi:signal transduction histidine kinase